MIKAILNDLLNQPRSVKQFILLAIDLLILPLCLMAGFIVRYESLYYQAIQFSWPIFPLAMLVAPPVFIRFGLYRSVIRYIGIQALITILQAVFLSVLLTFLLSIAFRVPVYSFSLWLVDGVLLTITIGGIRMLARYLVVQQNGTPGARRIPAAIYGAGESGVQLALALNHGTEFNPVLFLDDKRELHDQEVLGLNVYPPAQLPTLIEKFGLRQVLLALPSLSRPRRQEILRQLEPLPVKIMVVPDIHELVSGRKRVDEIREVGIEDMLGRNPVPPRPELMEPCIHDKSVLITGAGGSIGSELCRQIVQWCPKRLVLVERSEFALYSIDSELRRLIAEGGLQLELVPILGSTEHKRRMQAVMNTFEIQTVYHAAAYKHVPIVERNPIEGVQNNIFGTLSVAEAAIAAEVETFVLISTDKAVRPTNVMGATKRFTELILQGLAQTQQATRFKIVRFGNVLGSSGSVVPLFRDQIRRGGPVTVTDPEVVRYFMTIPEAAQLVIQAGSQGESGDVFVLEMGEPVRIHDFARRMILLAGLTIRDADNPDGDIEIRFTGLREGEKLYEELIIGDNVLPTEHEMIRRVHEESLPWEQVQSYLERFSTASRFFDYLSVRAILLEAVNGYHPTGGIQDWVWIRSNHQTGAAGP
ncbi:MAG: polysaccharide biosynthesis protein [Magnetococcales bacterium]|nr:polysaccharide biosynthesis protein [Magnetococcales bacterium]